MLDAINSIVILIEKFYSFLKTMNGKLFALNLLFSGKREPKHMFLFPFSSLHWFICPINTRAIKSRLQTTKCNIFYSSVDFEDKI